MVLCSLLALVAAARPGLAAPAPDWPALSTAATGATDEAAVAKVARDLEARLPVAPGDSTAADLEGASRVFGELVARGQDLELAPGVLEELVALGARLGERVKARQAFVEAQAGDDEAKLASLYRSDAWRGLSGSAVEVSFWLGWAQLARVDRGLDDPERAAALAEAERDFARAARALAFPDRAVRSLLGLGIARRERGDLEGARQSFERLRAQRAMRSDPALANRLRYELALTEIDALDMSAGQKLADELAKANAITPSQQLALEARQVRAWLRIAREQSGDRSEQAAGEAAKLLRSLLSRGGRDADVAARLIARYASDLAGRDLGALGALLEADRAFQAGDCERALASYSLALQAKLPAEVDVPQARLRAAWCKSRTGRSEQAMQDLEALLAGGLAGEQRADAARLLQSLAESAYRSSQREKDLARVNRAARILLETAPEGAGADLARYREASDLAARGRTDAALDRLGKIASDSESYPAALTLRIRLEARRLEKKRRAAGPRNAAVRAAAKELARSLDEASELRARGELPPDSEQEATMAAIRCEAAWLAGEDLASVERRIADARRHEGLTEAARLEILGVEISALAAAQEIPRLVALLEARNDDTLARELPVWQERLPDLAANAKATAALPEIYARLLEVAPASARGELRLGRIDALRRAGRGPEAVTLARELTKDEPEWGDAWVALARSLDATGDRDAAAEVWRRVGGGASPGSHSWWEARLGLYDAALAGPEPEKACGWLEAGKELPPAPGLESRIEKARARCSASPG